MPPVVRCVRHGQGHHNLGNYTLSDPRLTPLGEEQCHALLTKHFSDQSQISLVTASPLTRTLHTAILTFGSGLKNGKCTPTILAVPDAQETSDFPCDTGSDLPVLQAYTKERGWPIDLSLLRNDWNVKTMTGRYSPHSDAIAARAKAVRLLLRQKARELVSAGDENAEIMFVAHGGLLHYFTQDWEKADLYPGTGWFNCETRAYTFENDFMNDDDEDARLVETMESRKSRGLSHPMYGKEEQLMLFEEAMSGWEGQGLQRPDRLDNALEETDDEIGPLQREVTRRESMGIERRPSVVKTKA